MSELMKADFTPFLKRIEQLDAQEQDVYGAMKLMRGINYRAYPFAVETALDTISLWYFLNFDPLLSAASGKKGDLEISKGKKGDLEISKTGTEILTEVEGLRQKSRKFLDDLNNQPSTIGIPFPDDLYNDIFTLVRKIALIRQKCGLGWQARFHQSERDRLTEGMRP